MMPVSQASLGFSREKAMEARIWAGGGAYLVTERRHLPVTGSIEWVEDQRPKLTVGAVQRPPRSLKHQVLCATRREPIDCAARSTRCG
jgi:hypothetical protein